MPDSPNPWLFRRDELDVLEDELDEVFDLHEHSKNPVDQAMEARVIEEQVSTETAFENRVNDLLGPEPTDAEPHACEHCKDGFPDGVPLRDLLVRDRDPLYTRAYRWSATVFAWSRERYWQDGMRNRDMFRVHVNAHLVPVKIAFGQAEEARRDEHSSKIAVMEYEMAAAYLGRTRESLGALRSLGLLDSGLAWMIEEADRLAALIAERIRGLST